jgi:hypothetical protein
MTSAVVGLGARGKTRHSTQERAAGHGIPRYHPLLVPIELRLYGLLALLRNPIEEIGTDGMQSESLYCINRGVSVLSASCWALSSASRTSISPLKAGFRFRCSIW